ncbi:MAG: fibronectin type III domain-containing protein [Candidatus Sumerlaeaceae bacterium]
MSSLLLPRLAALACGVALMYNPGSVLATQDVDPGGIGPIIVYRPPHRDWRDTPAVQPVQTTLQNYYAPTAKAAAAAAPKTTPVLNSSARVQPTGALTGILVYCSGGHGWTADPTDTRPADSDRTWFTQRLNFNGVIEDYGNVEQLNAFAKYCYNAGATLIPFRPIDQQNLEVVLDNSSAGVTYSGTWNNAVSTIYYGNAGDAVPYRYASADAAAQIASAVYTPTLSAPGFYPVYTWVRWGGDRVNQLYRINHSGGETQLRVNHKRVGQGWVWLGTYHFNAGSAGNVVISNYAPGESGVVIADAIRFGNGMGDVDRGFGLSGYERPLENSRYWVQRGNGQGVSTDIYDWPSFDDNNDNVGTPPRKSADMNNEAEGNFWQRTFLSFHSNAGLVNTLGLHITSGSTGTTSQSQMAAYIGNEIANNMEAEDSGVSFEHDWISPRSQGALGGDFGEIRAFGSSPNIGNNDEMPATIAEVASHEDARDALLLRDPRCRDVIARGSYRAILKFLNDGSAGAVPLNYLPEPPRNVAARCNGSSAITVSWQAPLSGDPKGDPATGYVVYRSDNGYGFSNPVTIVGGATLSTTITGLQTNHNYYFQVAATNAGGESLPSEVLGVRMPSAGTAPVLVVNGFDRFDYLMSPRDTITSNTGSTSNASPTTIGVIRPRKMNSFDYVVQNGEALAACTRAFDSASNEAVSAGQVPLAGYSAVIWICGEESYITRTLDATEQALLTTYLGTSGNLFITGSEIGYDLVGNSGGSSFYQTQLGATYVADSSTVTAASGLGGSVFASIGSVDFSLTGGAPYEVEAADVISPQVGSAAAMSYTGPGTTAAVQRAGTGKVVYVAFPFEGIGSSTTRNEVMNAVMTYFAVPVPVGISAYEFD